LVLNCEHLFSLQQYDITFILLNLSDILKVIAITLKYSSILCISQDSGILFSHALRFAWFFFFFFGCSPARIRSMSISNLDCSRRIHVVSFLIGRYLTNTQLLMAWCYPSTDYLITTNLIELSRRYATSVSQILVYLAWEWGHSLFRWFTRHNNKRLTIPIFK
jgi:hypothetical protein